MAKAGQSGITSNTPKNILFGAGTIHKNLTYNEGAWNFEESLVGATSGGSKFTIAPEMVNIEADGADVKVKGLNVKTGETATMEINFLEITTDLIKASIIGAEGTSDDNKFTLIESKASIDEGDYWDNIAFVGKNLEGKNVIVILENALCTSGLELEGKAKEAGVGAFTFESHADLDGDHDKLPYRIYYPTAN